MGGTALPGSADLRAHAAPTARSDPMPCGDRARGIFDHGAVLRLLDTLRHGGSLRPVGNHGPPRSPAGESVRDSCVLLVNLLEKQGDRVFAQNGVNLLNQGTSRERRARGWRIIRAAVADAVDGKRSSPN
jgi:hypothetical protein